METGDDQIIRKYAELKWQQRVDKKSTCDEEELDRLIVLTNKEDYIKQVTNSLRYFVQKNWDSIERLKLVIEKNEYI